MSAWSDLPNATHIDAVLASVKANPKIWVKAWAKAVRWTESRNAAWAVARKVVQEAARPAAYNAAWNVAWHTSQDAVYHATQNEVYHAARDAARGVILALVAYDDCAHLLTTKPEHVKMMAEIGDEAAILLYPASLVFSEIENECLV